MISFFPIEHRRMVFITGVTAFVIATGGLFGSICAFAQNDPNTAGLVGVSTTVEPERVATGGKAVLKLKLKLPAGTHSNSDSPADPDLIPTAFYPKAQTGISWGHPRYPTPKKVIEWYADEPLSVFQDGAVITVEVVVGQSVSQGRLTLEGILHIQTCDSEKCYPPRQLSVRADVDVVSELKTRTEERHSNSLSRKSSISDLTASTSRGQSVTPKSTSLSSSFAANTLEFEFVDFAGKARKLSEFRGKFLLLDFWATWCKPCLVDIPKMKILYDKYKANGFEIIGMGSETLTGDEEEPDLEFAREAERRARQIVTAQGVSWTQATSETAVPVAMKIFRIKALPTKILIDREGRVLSTIGEKDDLNGILEKFLRGELPLPGENGPRAPW